MKINVTTTHFTELIKKGYDLNIIFFLRLIQEGGDVVSTIGDSERIKAIYQSLERKALITDEGKLTTIAQELLAYMDEKHPDKIIKRKVETTDFDRWWNAFPSKDIFEYHGKKFEGCRTLRQNREACLAKFDKIVLEGEYSADQLIKALEADILAKKEMSVKTGTNKLTYLQNSLTYLNQRSYESFIDVTVSKSQEFKDVDI